MLTIMIALTAASFVVLAVGFGLTLSRSGSTRQMREQEAGNEVVRSLLEDGPRGQMMGVRTAFRGKAVGSQSQAEYSFGEIKAAIRDGRVGDVMPIIMAVLGMFGFLFFGAIIVWLMASPVIGVFLVGAVVYAAVRTALAFRLG